MVAKIITGKSIMGALKYNENKVSEGVARLIDENLVRREGFEFTLSEKFNRFSSQTALNRRSKTNVVHISLNFSNQDKLDEELTRQIAKSYMQRIGFSEQPYLVYDHSDAGHPHIHILTISIKSDGSRIPLHNIGKNLSEGARLAVEKEFNLVKAGSVEKTLKYETTITPLVYGKMETKPAISRIVNEVFGSFRFTSIHEFNAALKQYNVIADRGQVGTRMFERGGLVYSALRKDEKVGVPIKSSSLSMRPTLKKLEKQFQINKILRNEFRDELRNKVLTASLRCRNMEEFQKSLQRSHVNVLVRKNEQGLIYGITFIDLSRKVVFNGSDLGKQCTAGSIQASFDNRTGISNGFQNQGKVFEMKTESVDKDLGDILFAPQSNVALLDGLQARKKRRRKSKKMK